MGVFSRLFSRQAVAAGASVKSTDGSDEHSAEAFEAAPHAEISSQAGRARTTQATGPSDMSKSATVPGESAVWRSDRTGSAAETHEEHTSPELSYDRTASQLKGPKASPRQPQSSPVSEPRVRLTSDLVPTARNRPATSPGDLMAPDADANRATLRALDDAFSRWMSDDGAPAEPAAERGSRPPLRPTRPPAPDDQSDQRAWLDTFSSIARLHIQPLRELLYHLSSGCTPRAWVQQTRPVLAPLLDAAQQTGEAQLLDALSELDTALELAESEAAALVGPVSRGAIQQAYARLGAHLPDTFGPPRSSDGRRLLLLEALLLQVPNLHRRELTKLYAAGIGSIQQLLQGSAEELSRAAGIELPLAAAIIEQVTRFSRERGGLDPARLRGRVAEQLKAGVGRLSQLQSEFERADSADNQLRKKAVRRARDAAALELQRLVAELGDVDLLEELKRCSARAKIARLQSYLQRIDGAQAIP